MADEIKRDYLDSALRGLGFEVVKAAVEDWRGLIKGHKFHGGAPYVVSFEEIESFLKSGWCASLLMDTGITGEQILEQLKEERRQAKKKKQEDN